MLCDPKDRNIRPLRQVAENCSAELDTKNPQTPTSVRLEREQPRLLGDQYLSRLGPFMRIAEDTQGGFQFEVQHPHTYIEGEHGASLQPVERDRAQRSS